MCKPNFIERQSILFTYGTMFVDEGGEASLKSVVFGDSSTFLLIFLFQELKIINQSIIIDVE